MSFGSMSDQEALGNYLNDILLQKPVYERKWCCGVSRSLYCTECCNLLIEREMWPVPLQGGKLRLPFDLDIILSDRRRSSTGFHALILIEANQNGGKRVTRNELHPDEVQDKNHSKVTYGNFESKNTGKNAHQKNTFSTEDEHVRLFDIKNGAVLPKYEDDEKTFVLFPSQKSIPLTSVSDRVRRLIVLDCKWTKTGSQQKIDELSKLPHVHLEVSMIPSESYFWRWHNAGSKCISTLEAIYYAALQIRQGSFKESECIYENLINLMWLFGVQRSLTSTAADERGKEKPFTDLGKENQRELRRVIKGSEKHMRDIEAGKKLREKAKLKTEVA